MPDGILNFQVSTRQSGRRRVVRVKVYDDLERLRRDANRYDSSVSITIAPTGRYTGTWASDALAVAHSRAEPDSPYAGMIRLWRGRLGTSVVVHEVAHIASGLYRLDHEGEHGPVHANIDNEEVLCYLIGDLTALIVDKLYDYGCYAPAA